MTVIDSVSMHAGLRSRPLRISTLYKTFLEFRAAFASFNFYRDTEGNERKVKNWRIATKNSLNDEHTKRSMKHS